MNSYKEIFDEITPSDELVDSVLSFESKKRTYKPVLAVCSVIVLVSVIGLSVYFCCSDDMVKKSDAVNLIVAYEMKKNDGVNYHISKKLLNGKKDIPILVRKKFGKGYVYVFIGTPCGPSTETSFWNKDYVSAILKFIKESRSAK